MVLVHFDFHLQNIGVRNDCTDGGPKTIFFDFESVMYSMRGKDIGHCLLTSLQKGEVRLRPREECKFFIQEYMKECKTLFDDWDENRMDSFDHIMMEAVIGTMITCMVYTMASLSFLPADLPDLEMMASSQNKCYFAMKQHFQSNYNYLDC